MVSVLAKSGLPDGRNAYSMNVVPYEREPISSELGRTIPDRDWKGDFSITYVCHELIKLNAYNFQYLCSLGDL